jgi:rhomboid protease GluP
LTGAAHWLSDCSARTVDHSALKIAREPDSSTLNAVDSALANPTTDPAAGTRLRARSERQAMDWSLALVSQGLEVTIEHGPGPAEWALVVPEVQAAQAEQTIRQYRLENRRFVWRRELPSQGIVFHGGALVWLAALALIFVLQGPLQTAGAFDTRAFVTGEWWRAATATWLHADVAHFASNATFGIVALGLAMGRFGAGHALLASLLAGIAGNLLGLGLRGPGYVGLGASGVVMGAMGMVVAQAVGWWRVSRHASRLVAMGLGAGVSLFLLVGMDPRADVLAHVGGFVAGLAAGAAATWWSWERFQRAALAVYVALAAGSWAWALLR